MVGQSGVIPSALAFDDTFSSLERILDIDYSLIGFPSFSKEDPGRGRETHMLKLHRFERSILAWALIGLVAAGPLAARDLEKKATSFSFVEIPQGTKTATLNWSVRPAVLPDREWNCGNGHGGFINMFSYTPSEWSVDVLDANTGATVTHQGGSTGVLTYSCPGDSAPTPPPANSSVQIDVSAFTADADAVFLVSTSNSGEVRTSTPGAPSEHFNCSPLGGPFNISAGVSVTSSPPVFRFELDPAQAVPTPNPWNTPPNARMLTHKYGLDDSYPSVYQVPNNDVHARPRFRFPGTATADGSGAALNLWFRVVDPPDTAPYVVQANDAHDKDNKDSFSGGKGILMTSGCNDFSAQSTCAALNGGVLATTSGPDGKVELVLEATDRFAGDNYQILASFGAPGDDGKFACEEESPNTCAKSAPITAWKRIYEEQHAMFRRGSFLEKDALAGDTDIFVKDVKMFHPGDHVVLVHSDGGGARPVSESHFVEVVPRDRQANIAAHLHLTDSGLARAFLKSTDPQRVFLGDAVGVSNNGGSTDEVYVAYLGPFDGNGARPVDELFATMFIDVLFTPADLPFLPLFDGITDSRSTADKPSEASQFAQHWFQNLPHAGENHRMLIGAARSDTNGQIGVTADRFDLLASYSFRGKIEDMVHEDGGVMMNLDPDIVTFENVAHELTHQWRVNINPRPPGGDDVGHCVENAFDNPRMFCRMAKNWTDDSHNGERADGIIKLHYVKRNSVVDSEYVTARQAAEPMP